VIILPGRRTISGGLFLMTHSEQEGLTMPQESIALLQNFYANQVRNHPDGGETSGKGHLVISERGGQRFVLVHYRANYRPAVATSFTHVWLQVVSGRTPPAFVQEHPNTIAAFLEQVLRQLGSMRSGDDGRVVQNIANALKMNGSIYKIDPTA
jgi:hypothetical protein